MKKPTRKTFIIICLVVLSLGLIELLLYMGYSKARKYIAGFGARMEEAEIVKNEYQSRPQEFFADIDAACASLLHAYREYTDYPYYVPLDDNPVIPTAVQKIGPQAIRVNSADQMSLTLVQVGKHGGLLLTWTRGPDGTTTLIIGNYPDIGDLLYKNTAE